MLRQVPLGKFREMMNKFHKDSVDAYEENVVEWEEELDGAGDESER